MLGIEFSMQPHQNPSMVPDLSNRLFVTLPELQAGYVPYVGAIQDVNLGSHTLTSGGASLPWIQFDTGAVPLPTAPGLLQWNDTDETLDLGMPDGVTLQIGQENQLKARNNTGSTILNGSPVYESGMLGNRPTIALARGDSEATGSVMGLVTQDIADNADGKVTTSGYVRNIDTTGAPFGETWADGDQLWVSKATAGYLTNVEPSAPHFSDLIGTVVNAHATQGSILVRIRQHQSLEGLSDVNGTALSATGQIPAWNQTAGYFDFTENITDYAKILHDYGTQGSVLFLGSSGQITEDNSNFFFDDTNNRLGIGTASPSARLDVYNGDIYFGLNTYDATIKIADITSGDSLQGGDLTVSAGSATAGSNMAGGHLILKAGNSRTGAGHVSGDLRLYAGANNFVSGGVFGDIEFYTGGYSGSYTQSATLIGGTGNMLIGTTTDVTAFGGARLQVKSSGSSTGTWRGRIVAGGDNYVFLMGEYNSNAWLGAHNAALSAWAPLYIQPQGGADVGIGYDGTTLNTSTDLVLGGRFSAGVASASAKIHAVSTTEQLRLGYDASNYLSTTVSSAGLVTLDAVGSGSAFSFSDRVQPTTNDGAALGSTSLSWSDLFLASGAVVNFNNGNYTVTHSAGVLTFSGEVEMDGALNHDGTTVGLYGVTPVTRATTGIAEAAFVENAGGTAVNADSTFGGYTLQQVVQALQSIGILT